MSSPGAPQQPLTPADVVRFSHPAHAVVVALLLPCAWFAFGARPGLVTATLLALVTPSLVLIDARIRRLPNVLVVPGLAAVVVDVVWSSISQSAIPLAALATTAAVLVVMLGMNLLGGIGMGDVKLSGVITGCLALVSPWLAVGCLLAAFIVGGGYSAVLILSSRGHHGRRIPFGPFLLVSFWSAVLLGAAVTTR